MDNKPLLQERPPAYNLEAGQGDYAYGRHNYGAIPVAPAQPGLQPSFQPGFQPPPPYPYSVAGQSAYAPGSYRFPAQTVFQPSSAIVVVGGCPACRVGVLEESFTCLGILLAILLFPIGFICCFALRRQKCPNCGVVYF
ncbi:brain protein I3 isoform X1 [Trichosurus vulpecula]|uniref:brain protein I3 isoform X1 n=1 Tax=Trichosurus vulpecula TaxID=9337 RepID=UPI00186AD21B|nr:brain protein I3 isoform X1 [Trichosurus vulpecula]